LTAQPTRRIAVLAGARPNFVKVAPLLRALSQQPATQTILIHTGQHYSTAMSRIFFRELGIRTPDAQLEVGSGSHAVQTGRVLARLERVLLRERPDRLLVVGDVNSTMAGALAAAKLCVPVDHVEAGLRSFDRTMPEEINRVVTDSIATLLFASEAAAVRNLRREGHSRDRVHLVGNVMIDTLVDALPRAREKRAYLRWQVARRQFGVLTLHRPSNVDETETLYGLLDSLGAIAAKLPLIFPIHPRTAARIGPKAFPRGIVAVRPLGYLDFLSLLEASRLVITDSGGIQEETSFLRVPCLTLRTSTERPVTVSRGTSTLVGHDGKLLRQKVAEILEGSYKAGHGIPHWDGRAAERIAATIAKEST
jgi:UDP-N-acetylglucosamine 2-epimerase (non-hydrolysing)